MRLTTHLTFGGDCAAAFRSYERALGGKLEVMVTYGETPLAEAVPPAWRDRIVHATLTIGEAVIAGADVEGYERPRGFFVLVNARDAGEAERVFAALSEGGRVTMPLQPVFWSEAFGVVIDRFGVPWEVTTDQDRASQD